MLKFGIQGFLWTKLDIFFELRHSFCFLLYSYNIGIAFLVKWEESKSKIDSSNRTFLLLVKIKTIEVYVYSAPFSFCSSFLFLLKKWFTYVVPPHEYLPTVF